MHINPFFLVSVLLLALLAVGIGGCTAVPTTAVQPTPSPTPTSTPLPTWTPTPAPTPTPIPSAQLEIHWPDVVSPLTPQVLEVSLVPPPGLDANASISATIMDPEPSVYATFALTARAGNRFRATEALTLPLQPPSGFWWLIVHVDAELPVAGRNARYFEIAPVVFRELTGTLPSAVTMQVPEGFDEVLAQGDPYAGGRVWAHEAGEVALWWAPGPAEELLLHNAVTMLEATYAADSRSETSPALDALPTTWQGRTAFEFSETWPEPEAGPGRAWVIQGDDHWLYALRLRAVGQSEIPTLHRDVAQTFAFSELGE
ncbi:MAG: hypothetical protein ACP5HG_02300 [Anaerolineae bacterium]